MSVLSIERSKGGDIHILTFKSGKILCIDIYKEQLYLHAKKIKCRLSPSQMLNPELFIA